MINKVDESLLEAVTTVKDGDSVLIGGFGSSGIPFGLIDALVEHGASDLEVISNNSGVGEFGISRLLKYRQVRRIVCSFPRSAGSVWFERLYEEGAIELELVPQGTLAERIRAAGSGLGGFFTPTGYGTGLAEGKETRMINGRGHVFEEPLAADVALIRAHRADPWGNLVYNTAARNFNPVMAMAGRTTIAEAGSVVALGELDPEAVVTPGIFVDRVIEFKGEPCTG